MKGDILREIKALKRERASWISSLRREQRETEKEILYLRRHIAGVTRGTSMATGRIDRRIRELQQWLGGGK